MNVQAPITREAKADELLWRDVVTGKGQRHEERTAVEREEQLSAVWVVIRVPEHHAPRRIRVIFSGHLGRLREREDVVAVYRLVPAIQDVAAPRAREDPFGGTALVARAGVHAPRAKRRPAYDLDAASVGVGDQAPVALER